MMLLLYVHYAATKFVGVDCALVPRVFSTMISKRYSLRFGIGPCTPTFFGEVLLKEIMHCAERDNAKKFLYNLDFVCDACYTNFRNDASINFDCCYCVLFLTL